MIEQALVYRGRKVPPSAHKGQRGWGNCKGMVVWWESYVALTSPVHYSLLEHGRSAKQFALQAQAEKVQAG